MGIFCKEVERLSINKTKISILCTTEFKRYFISINHCNFNSAYGRTILGLNNEEILESFKNFDGKLKNNICFECFHFNTLLEAKRYIDEIIYPALMIKVFNKS